MSNEISQEQIEALSVSKGAAKAAAKAANRASQALGPGHIVVMFVSKLGQNGMPTGSTCDLYPENGLTEEQKLAMLSGIVEQLGSGLCGAPQETVGQLGSAKAQRISGGCVISAVFRDRPGHLAMHYKMLPRAAVTVRETALERALETSDETDAAMSQIMTEAWSKASGVPPAAGDAPAN